MKYIVEPLSKTKEIMDDYHVNSLLAKVIEYKDWSLEDYKEHMASHLIYHDFSLFSEGEMALDRIHEAMENNEKICIYGDYDCDGILATSILVEAFKELGIHVGYHIPNRFTDGYGLNAKRVKQIAEKGYTLIITVDNGISAFEAVDTANACGVDVIITDHHSFEPDHYPDACCIVHPKMGSSYPMKEICGGFVAYKLAAALLGHHDRYLYTLAGITTISDMMPLVDENRSVVQTALRFMEKYHFPQIEALGSKQYTPTAIGFTIAPKINAFGRLPEIVNPNNLVKFFMKDCDQKRIMATAKVAVDINTKRQNLTSSAYEEALQTPHDDCLFYSSDTVHEGIVGLIAGKYTNEFERPAFVMHHDVNKHIYKGSARGVNGFNIYEFLTNHEDLFLTFGGHAMAGGFSLDEDHYEAFHDALLKEVEGKDFQNETTVIPIELSDLSLESVASLKGLEPFGEGNEEPLFVLNDTQFENVRQLSEGKHLRFDKQLVSCRFSALYFNKGDAYDQLKDGKMSPIGTLSINEFRGYKSVNMIIKDLLDENDTF